MKTFNLAQLASLTESTLVGNPSATIFQVADLEKAGPQDASFLANPRYESLLKNSKAGVVFIHPSIPLPDSKNFLQNESPSKAFQMVVDQILGDDYILTGFENIHPTAVIHPTAQIGSHVQIGPHVVIDKEAIIGDHTFIGAGTYIGPRSTIGTHCQIHPHVTIRENCILGNRVVLQPGAVIGSCGFGFISDAKGKHTKLNQLGSVIIEDDVEIGANTTIDRARFRATKIKKGTKIDNLVQIGHGVVVGEDNLIIAQTGIAGSTETGKNVVLAGQTALAGHIKLDDGVILSARSVTSKSLPKGTYGGAPAIPLAEHNRNGVYLRNLEKHLKGIFTRLDRLETN